MATALIIGASRGIGAELAKQYVADGWRVLATARTDADLQNLRQAGCEAFKLDVTSLTDCAGAGWHLDDEKLDLAILNAGIYGPHTSGLQAPDQQTFDRVMQTNVLAAMRLLPILLPMTDAAAGKLIAVSSVMASIAMRENSAGWLYRASKAALNSVLRDVSLQAKSSICTAIHPGWLKTDMGGAGADLEVSEGVRAIRRTIAALTPADHGQFIDAIHHQPLRW